MAEAANSVNNGEIALEVIDLWKIFGPGSEDLVESEIRAVSKEEIQEKTGCVVAVRETSFSVERASSL